MSPRDTVPEALRRSFDFVNDPKVRADYKRENDGGRQEKINQFTIEAPEGFRKVTIEVYACPTPGCPDFFGHHNMPDFGARAVGVKDLNYSPKPASEHRTRATCPTCFARGLRAERVRVAGFVFVPLHPDQLIADREAAAPPESTGIHA